MRATTSVTAASLVVLALLPAGCGFGVADALRPADSRVSAEGFAAIQFGSPLPDLENTLGPSHAPTNADFTAICGDRESSTINSLSRHRPIWEQYASQDQVVAWSSGGTTILAFFHKPWNQDGRMIRKILHDSGGTLDSQGGFDVAFGYSARSEERSPSPQPEPPHSTAPAPGKRPFSLRDFAGHGRPGSAPAEQEAHEAGEEPMGERGFPTVDAALAAFAQDPGLSRRLLAPGRKVAVTGTYDGFLVTVVQLSSDSGSGRVEARLHGGAAARIGGKRQGEPITVRGRLVGFDPRGRILRLTDCDFE